MSGHRRSIRVVRWFLEIARVETLRENTQALAAAELATEWREGQEPSGEQRYRQTDVPESLWTPQEARQEERQTFELETFVLPSSLQAYQPTWARPIWISLAYCTLHTCTSVTLFTVHACMSSTNEPHSLSWALCNVYRLCRTAQSLLALEKKRSLKRVNQTSKGGSEEAQGTLWEKGYSSLPHQYLAAPSLHWLSAVREACREGRQAGAFVPTSWGGLPEKALATIKVSIHQWELSLWSSPAVIALLKWSGDRTGPNAMGIMGASCD